jgi:hypothetical protein
MADLLQEPPNRDGSALEPRFRRVGRNGREVSERQVLPAGGLRERFDQQRPRTVPWARLLLFQTADCSPAADWGPTALNLAVPGDSFWTDCLPHQI